LSYAQALSLPVSKQPTYAKTSMTEAHILIVDDNPGVLSAGKLFLKRHFAVVETAKDPEAIPQILQDQRYDVILLDMNFNRNKNTGQEGLLWLDRILDIDPTAVVVLITAYGDVDLAVRAIKKGATDFVLKPWENYKKLHQCTYMFNLQQHLMLNYFWNPMTD
jgi:DNA-binding NtrC family response regulator